MAVSRHLLSVVQWAFLWLVVPLVVQVTPDVTVVPEYWSETIAAINVTACRAKCSLRPGGFLATIESAAENALVFATKPGGVSYIVLGANRLQAADTNNYRWTDGPLGLEDGGLGRKLWNGHTTSGSCNASYCNFASGDPNGNDATSGENVIVMSPTGVWWDVIQGGTNAACACKRFKSVFFTTELPTITTDIQTDCDTRCGQVQPNSVTAWISSAQENAALTNIFFPRVEAYYVLGANSRSDGTHFIWTATGVMFFEKGGSCTSGVYCNFDPVASPAEPSSAISQSQVVVYAGNMSNHPTGSWHDMAVTDVFGGCACRTYVPKSRSNTKSATSEPTSDVTGTESRSATTDDSSTVTVTDEPTATQSGNSRTSSLTKDVTSTVSVTPTGSTTATPTPSMGTVTDHFGYERFRYWFVEVSLPMQSSCNVFCGADGGFPAYATSYGENLRVMASIPPHIHTALLGASRSYDSVNYRWVAGPLGARNQQHGAPFFNGPTFDTGNCTLYCNFSTGMPNATATSTQVVMYGPAAGPLFGQWMNADPGVGEGCACMSITFHSYSQNVSRSESISVSETSPNPYWYYPLTTATQYFSQCRSGCQKSPGGQMASIRSAVEQQMALNVLPSNNNIGQVLLGGARAGSVVPSYRWTEGIFAAANSLVWSGNTTLYGGSCLQRFCNFVTVNITEAANLTVQEGPCITMWADGPLRGYWGEGNVNVTKGCLCQRAEVTVSAKITNTRSVPPTITVSNSASASEDLSPTTSLSPTNQASSTMTLSQDVTTSTSKTPSSTPSASFTGEPTFSTSLSEELSPTHTRSLSPVPIDFWYFPAPNPTIAQCRGYCLQRKNGFIATVENSVEAAQVAKTLPAGAQGMLGGSRLAPDTSNFRWKEGPLAVEDGGLGRLFYAGAANGTCQTYCNWKPGQPLNGAVVYARQLDGGQWVDASQTAGTGCVCKRYNTYSLRMSRTNTVVLTDTITLAFTPSTTDSDVLSMTGSVSASKEQSSSRTKTLRLSASKTLIATPTPTSTTSQTQATNTINPTPTRNTISLSEEPSESKSKSPPTTTMSMSAESSLTPTLLQTPSTSPSSFVSTTRSLTKRTVGNLSPSKTSSPSQEPSTTDSKESSFSITGSSDPSETDSLMPSFTLSKEVSSSLTASDERSLSANTLTSTRSSSPSDSEELSASRSSTASVSVTEEFSTSPTVSATMSTSLSPSMTKDITKSLQSPSHTKTRPCCTHTLSLSLKPTHTRRRHTRSDTLTSEPTPTKSLSFAQSASLSVSATTSNTPEGSRTTSATGKSGSVQSSATSSKTPLLSLTMPPSQSMSSSWQKTKASRSLTLLPSNTRQPTKSGSLSEELSPTHSVTASSSRSATFSTTWSDSLSNLASSMTITRSPLPTPSASASAEKGTSSISGSALSSLSFTQSKEAPTATVSATSSLSLSRSNPSVTSDLSETPTLVFSVTLSDELSASQPTSTPSSTDDKSGSFSSSVSNSVRVPTKSASVSDSREDTGSKTASLTTSQEATVSPLSVTPTQTQSLTNSVALNSTTVGISLSNRLSPTTSRGSHSKSAEPTATKTPSLTAGASTTQSHTGRTKVITPSATASSVVSTTASVSAHVSVTAPTQSYPTPTHTRSLRPTATPTIIATPSHTASTTLSASASPTLSTTPSLTQEAATPTLSTTKLLSATVSTTVSDTREASTTDSTTASIPVTITAQHPSESVSSSLSSMATLTKTRKVSESFKTPTIHTMYPLPFVFAPRNVASWSSSGVPIIGLLANQSTSSNSNLYVDLTIYPVDEDTGEASESPYRSPVMVSAEMLPTNENRDIISIDAEGFPRSINITADDAILPAHLLVLMDQALPDPMCVAPSSASMSGTLRVGIQYAMLGMEYFSQSALIVPYSASLALSTSSIDLCMTSSSESADSFGSAPVFLVTEVPQGIVLQLSRAGYFAVAATSVTLSAAQPAIALPGLTMLGGPVQWVHLESIIDEEVVPLMLRYPASSAAVTANASLRDVNVTIAVGTSHVSRITSATIDSCPRRYAGPLDVPHIMLNVSAGAIRMPYTVVSSVVPGDRWECTFVSGTSKAVTAAVRLSGCMLHCPTPPSANMSGPFRVVVGSQPVNSSLSVFAISTIAWPSSVFTAGNAIGGRVFEVRVAPQPSTTIQSSATRRVLSTVNDAPVTMPVNWTLRTLRFQFFSSSGAVPFVELGFEVSHVSLQLYDASTSASVTRATLDIPGNATTSIQEGEVRIPIPAEWDVCVGVGANANQTIANRTLHVVVAIMRRPTVSLHLVDSITAVAQSNVTLQCQVGLCQAMADIVLNSTAASSLNTTVTSQSLFALEHRHQSELEAAAETPIVSPSMIASVQGCVIDVFPVTTSCITGNVVTLRLDPWWAYASNGSSVLAPPPENEYFIVLVRQTTVVVNGTTTTVNVDEECTDVTWGPATQSANCTLPELPAASTASVELRHYTLGDDGVAKLNVTTAARLSNAVYYSDLKFDGCPKSVLNATCSDHGTCNVLTLTCECDSDAVLGYYSGSLCSVCTAGYYGVGCVGRCPGAGCSVCSGHGVCSDGEAGSGRCTCYSGMNSGFWSSTDCADCASSYYGANCTTLCVTDRVNGLVCGGHGVCSSGMLGTGLCTCDVGFASTATASCTVCTTGYYSSSCLACPTTVSLVPCSGHGVCSDGVNGNGTCSCKLGFGGASCSAVCPVDFNATCGWGSCAENSTCTCKYPIVVNTSLGTCSTCAAGWWGTQCQNVCSCTFGTCNPRTGDCKCNFGYWGPTCASACPGGATNPCSGHGTCLATNGTCVCYANSTHGHYTGSTCSTCDPLYNSPKCDVICPYDPITLEPCARRGLCYNGTCSGRCIIGYFGALCDQVCPGGADTPCTNHGSCDETSGICTCSYGYAGNACQNTCPPGDSTNPPCFAHGVCTDTGACSCYANTTAGYWSGTSCNDCASQYSGASCTVLCNPSGGRVSGKTCVCSAGFVGASCNLICPTGGVDGSVCGGQGSCADANGTKAICTCATNYYGTACDTWCTPANCVASLGLYRAQCNLLTGQCECLVGTQGRFTGALCDTCAYGYWGAECDSPCSCNGRGCDRYTATCVCSAGVGGGLWAGEACDVCAANYIGVTCTQRNIEVNNATSASFSAVNAGYPAVGIDFHDPVTDIVLVGSNPIGVFQTAAWSTTMIPLSTFSLASVAIDCSAFNSSHLAIRLMPASPQLAIPVVFVQRLPLTQGVIVVTGDNTTHVSSNATILGSSAMSLQAQRALRIQSTTSFSLVTNANRTSFNSSSSCSMFAEGAAWLLQCQLGSLAFTFPSTVVWMGFVGANVAVVTWTEPTSTVAWGMCVVRLPNATHQTPVVILSTTSAKVNIADCEALGGCATVGYCVSPSDAANSSMPSSTSSWNESVIVCGASTSLTTGNSLVFFAIDYTTGLKVSSSAVVPSASGLTSAIVDAGYNNAIFSFVGATTAMLCRIQLSDPLTLITLFSVDRVNGDRPDVLAMSLNATTRTLWLSVATSEAVVAVAVNLFSISIVAPAVFDRLGGVTVTVIGIGFVPDPTPLCDFHTNETSSSPSASSSSAVFVNSTTLLCVAASVSQYDASCSTLMLNVWYGGRVTSTTLGGTSRPLTATVDSATTALSGGMPRTFHTARTLITLAGFGFVTSAVQATCRIEEANGTVIAVLLATPVSVTTAYCHQTTTLTPTHLNAGIRYSHDGFVYSEMANFAVVGEWAGLLVSAVSSNTTSSSLTVQAQPATLVPSILVETTDAYGNVLGQLDSSSRQIICSSLNPVLLSDVTAQQPLFASSSSTIQSTSNGSTVFANVQLASPATGTQTLYFFPTLDRTASATISVTVTPGKPSVIAFMVGTSQVSWFYGVTTTFTIPSFSAVVLDAVGNTVTDETQLPTTVSVRYTNIIPPVADTTGGTPQATEVTYAATRDSKTASYPFAGLTTRSSFGNDVVLRFSTSDSTVKGLLYTMTAESCGSGSYGVQGGYECIVCPGDASCDGTTVITAAPGYWRGTVTSPFLYACSPAVSCPSSTTCAAGYEGAICGSCEAGYGRTVTSCDLCGSVVAPWIFVALIVLGFIGGVWALALRTVAFSAPADVEARIVEIPAKPSAVSILVKIALSHVQILSLLPLRRLAVSFVASALSSSGSWSVVTPGFLDVACAIGRRAVNEMYATVALAGLVGLGLCVVAYFIAYFDDQRFRAEAKRRAAVQRAKVAKEAKASPVLFRAADEAHSAALFNSNAQCKEVLRNHKELLEEYDGDVAKTRVDPNDVQGWLNLEFDLDDDGNGGDNFIPLADLAANANGGLGPEGGIATTGVKRPAIWKRSINVALLGFIVVTFLLYPTVVQAAVKVIQCKTVQLGGGKSVSVVAYDPAIDCSSSDYIAGQVPAVAVLIAFGAGVPLLSPLAIIFARRYTCDGSLQRACQLFFFVTGGYRLWFWEGIVLARKAVIVVVVVLVADDQVVCIVTMWLLGASLVLNLVLLPWEVERLGALESLSLGALSLTSLCLAAFSSSGQAMGDGISMSLVVVVAAINIMVLLALVGELSRQATNEVIELTGLEVSPQWTIDALRRDIAQIQHKLRRRKFARVSDVSEILSAAHSMTLLMVARRHRSMTALTSKMELDRQHNEIIEKEKMMHYDWDPSSLSSDPLGSDRDHDESFHMMGITKMTSGGNDYGGFFRPSTVLSNDGQRQSRQRNVFFDMPDDRANDEDETAYSPNFRRSALVSPSSMRSVDRGSLRLSHMSFRMEGSSDDSHDSEDAVLIAHPDIVNPFRDTCFEDNPYDVLVRSGQGREFLRSREQTLVADLGEVEALDMNATLSTPSTSSNESFDQRRYKLQSRERATAFTRPSVDWNLPSLVDPMELAHVDIPGIAHDTIDFDVDISVEDIDLYGTHVIVGPWGEEDTIPSLFEEDDELLASVGDRKSRKSRRQSGVSHPVAQLHPQLFRSETSARRQVEAAMTALESQFLGAARTFWAVLSDVRTASEQMSMQKVLRLNARLAELLEELYRAEHVFVHVVWSYERCVRSGTWDHVVLNVDATHFEGGKGGDPTASGNGSGPLSEDRYLTGSLDLNDCDFESMDAVASGTLQ